MQYEDEDYDLDALEDEKLLFDNKDYPALLELRKQRATAKPEDLFAWQRYAEALNLNKMHQEAIEVIEPHYRENHDFGFGVPEIIDALYGMEKTEDDFDWIEKPEVIKLDEDILDICSDFLRKRGSITNLYRLYENLLNHGDYLSFNLTDFAGFLSEYKDKFELSGDIENPLYMEVTRMD